jgi:DNA-binding CsgD family transcriptional regulator
LHDSWLATHSATEKRFALYEMWIDALLAAADGASEVPARFEAVVELAHRRGNRLYEVWALMDLGRSQAAADDRAGAVRSWQRAVIIADDLGARSEAQLLGQLLRSIGVRRMPTTSGEGVGSPVANLTAREREVAAQAARGRRNAEIAAALFVSTKTVERHLSSIFAKLQVRSRGELAARYGSLVAGPTMSDSPR